MADDEQAGPSLGLPPAALDGFPSSEVPVTLVRVCRAGRGPWWFSSDGRGRFDLPAPEGTCYLATDRYAAVREASRGGPVTPGWAALRRTWYVAPPVPGARLAATTRAAAGAFGLTKELVTMLPYEVPRAWALAFRRQGFAGIRHELRHDPRARPSGVALFGHGGAPGWGAGRSEPLTAEVLATAGVKLWAVPTVMQLRVVP